MKNNNIAENMELLLYEVHKEWERSGKTKVILDITTEEAAVIMTNAGENISELSEALENDEVYSFEECLNMSKECFVLLRMIKKVIKVRKRAVKDNRETFRVEFDYEEYKAFAELLNKSR